ncbi:MAG: hypothetical protein K0Q68_295 [Moraxellaceae bacterium]|jgi:GTPase SAR1 family protein|nr:hypothetical protein [Moraxellaceae bacterium]
MRQTDPYGELEDLLPDEADQVDQLRQLVEDASVPRIAVVGKYNHGKSSLLNALIGKDVFKASDKRETTEVRRYESNGITWIDTPGLDADVAGHDDHLARQVAYTGADALLVVHSAVDGELDQCEADFLRALAAAGRTDRALLVISCVDNVDEGALTQTLQVISRQVGSLSIPIMEVSSTRYVRGKIEGKQRLSEASGFVPLKAQIAVWLEGHADNKKAEIQRLRTQLLDRLSTNLSLHRTRLEVVESSFALKKLGFQLQVTELLLETRKKVAAL